MVGQRKPTVPRKWCPPPVPQRKLGHTLQPTQHAVEHSRTFGREIVLTPWKRRPQCLPLLNHVEPCCEGGRTTSIFLSNQTVKQRVQRANLGKMGFGKTKTQIGLNKLCCLRWRMDAFKQPDVCHLNGLPQKHDVQARWE